MVEVKSGHVFSLKNKDGNRTEVRQEPNRIEPNQIGSVVKYEPKLKIEQAFSLSLSRFLFFLGSFPDFNLQINCNITQIEQFHQQFLQSKRKTTN